MKHRSYVHIIKLAYVHAINIYGYESSTLFSHLVYRHFWHRPKVNWQKNRVQYTPNNQC